MRKTQVALLVMMTVEKARSRKFADAETRVLERFEAKS
jgi:hypothetical protein